VFLTKIDFEFTALFLVAEQSVICHQQAIIANKNYN
jgi:hypothetical protein